MAENWCLSGGAIGADLVWGHAAQIKGHDVTHFSFQGHRSKAKHLHVLSPEELASADPFCQRASVSLKKRFPLGQQTSPYVIHLRNLLRRNWFQVQHSTACYAVSTIKDGIVQGGTGWAVQMFIDRHDSAPCAAYVFDQIACLWYQWNGEWMRLYTPPTPTGVWTGIGTRKITFAGRLAIHVLLDYWPRNKTIWTG